MYTTQSHFNRIYHNNFFDNFYQAPDLADTNQWDDGYPSGGNYWDNHRGEDLRGLCQRVGPSGTENVVASYPYAANLSIRLPSFQATSPSRSTPIS
ncbi:MAG: hypothetical protein ACW99G_04675 [Candidatus Thorarchaeota archaeon]